MSDGTNVIQTLLKYNNGSMILPLCLLLLGYLLVYGTKEGKRRIFWYTVISVVFVFNEVIRFVIGKFTDLKTYYRFFWIVPLLLVIAYVLTRWWFEVKGIPYRMLIVAMTVLLSYLVADRGYLTKVNFHSPSYAAEENDAAMQVCEMIADNKAMETPVVAMDYMTQLKSRVFDPSIQWGISRKAYLHIMQTGVWVDDGKYNRQKVIYRVLMNGEQVDPDELKKAVKKLKIDYLVVNEAYGLWQYFEDMGWYAQDSRAGYVLYRCQ